MERKRNWIERFADGMDLNGEPMPGQPLVELAGDCRVLIEHHFGVTQYSTEKVCVRVRYGTVAICGKFLEIRHMSKAQLVISGQIECITVNRRGRD